ncbi:MAG TPA: YciI family protein [Aliidongia sp.]|nr:YciI family protein [Aliidongia sp.]
MQFLILGRDGTDAEAPARRAAARRAAARPPHLAGVRALKAAGHFVLGGARLDAAGAMVGTMMIVEFADRAALDAWLPTEPYVAQGVWREIEIQPFRVATFD